MIDTIKTKLYIIPYAGGSKYSFAPFLKLFREYIDVKVLELPGRGERFSQNLLCDINSMVSDLFDQIEPDEPYAIWGHSMGGLLGFLLAKKVLGMNKLPPRVIFISGCSAPSIKRDFGRHVLNTSALKKLLYTLGGVSNEVLEDDQLMEVFEPIIRADFKALDTYKYETTPPIDIPLVILKGSEENQDINSFIKWNEESTKEIQLIELTGNHFFIFEHKQTIVELIKNGISDLTLSTNL